MSLTLINVDLSSAELRCMAVFSGDVWMINALQEGAGDYFDVHMMPVAFPSILERYGTVEAYKESEPVNHKEDRTKCKAVVYGLAFGRQAYAIGKALKMTERGAQTIIDNYLSTASGFAQWRKDVMVAAVDKSKRDLLTNPFGRRFQSEIITHARKDAIEREALSFLPQSTSSDICLGTAIRINPKLKEAGYHIFNMVHDAIMIEGPEEHADMIGEWVGQELRQTAADVMGTAVPFLSDYSKGKSWADLS